MMRLRYKASAVEKIRAKGHKVAEREVHTVGGFDDALSYINKKYPGAAVSYSDMEVLPARS